MGRIACLQVHSPGGARSAVTGPDMDRLEVRMPTLRCAEMTWSYLRDGAASTQPIQPPCADSTPHPDRFGTQATDKAEEACVGSDAPAASCAWGFAYGRRGQTLI